MSTFVFQSLRYIGADDIDDVAISRTRSVLTPKMRRELLADARYSDDWIAAIARRIAGKEGKHG
jgi:hypothetical protein